MNKWLVRLLGAEESRTLAKRLVNEKKYSVKKVGLGGVEKDISALVASDKYQKFSQQIQNSSHQ